MNEKHLHYYDSDLKLFVILVLLETYHDNEDILTLANFLKCNYWNMEEIEGELIDTNDFASVEDLVLHQILYIAEELKLCSIKAIGIDDVDKMLFSVIQKAMKSEQQDDHAAGYYYAVVSEMCSVRWEQRQRLEKNMEKIRSGKGFDRELFHKVMFSRDEYHRYLNDIASAVPEHVLIEFKFKPDTAAVIEKEVEQFVSDFSQDKYFQDKPLYSKKRLYFSKQIENFCEYVNKLPIVDKVVNIPFTALEQDGFEVIKLLKFLQNTDKITLKRWGDEEHWHVNFDTVPITPNSLVAGTVSEEVTKLKTDLSFDEEKSVLLINNKPIKIRKNKDQYHLLRVMFGNKKELGKEWFFSEVAEKFDPAEPPDDKKFYNAAYQLQQKIIIIKNKTETGIEPLFLTKIKVILRNHNLDVDRTELQ